MQEEEYKASTIENVTTISAFNFAYYKLQKVFWLAISYFFKLPHKNS